MGAFIDLTGKQFGRLVVKQKLDKRGKEWYWLCECECGNTKEVRGVSLREGKVKSCGCLKFKNINNEYYTLYKQSITYFCNRYKTKK